MESSCLEGFKSCVDVALGDELILALAVLEEEILLYNLLTLHVRSLNVDDKNFDLFSVLF